MKSAIGLVAATLSTLLWCAAVRADVDFFFDPVTSNVAVGDTFSVDVKANLATPGAGVLDDLISAFDFDVTYDQTLLSAQSVSFGGFLGDGSADLNTGSLRFDDLTTAGIANVFESSNMSDAQLAALQNPPNPITLVTVTFQALAEATSTPLNIVFGSFQDVKGRVDPNTGLPAILTVNTDTGVVNIGPAAAPIPTTAALLLLALLPLRSLSRRRASTIRA